MFLLTLARSTRSCLAALARFEMHPTVGVMEHLALVQKPVEASRWLTSVFRPITNGPGASTPAPRLSPVEGQSNYPGSFWSEGS